MGLLGEAEAPSKATDFVYLGGGLVVGVLIGIISTPFAGASLSQRRRIGFRPRLWLAALPPADLWAVPQAASQTLKELAVYIAAIGLTSAPGILALLKARG